MRPLKSLRNRRAHALIAGCWLLAGAPQVRADNAVIPDATGQIGLRGSIDGPLQLQAIVNGRDTRQIVAVTRDAKGRFSVSRADLVELGVKAGRGPAVVALDSLPGLVYRYDEAAQTLKLDVPVALLAPRVYSAGPPRPPGYDAPLASDWGAAINYDLFASSASWWPGQRLAFGSGSATLDARAFSPFGVLHQSGIVGSTAFNDSNELRLDTGWRFDDASGRSYQAGDLITAGLPWTRPVRLGGVQVQHDFGLRPDLVTGPSATVSGTAAVPSSVDVFLNNFKVYSQAVDAGPFSIQNLPTINGGGSATLVLRDVTGKETTSAVPFFVSSRLLTPGALDYSLEAGYARRNYGLSSFDYDPHLVASGSLRTGVFDFLTLEAHAEGGDGLVNGGVGASVDLFQRALFEASLAGSRYGGETRGQASIGFSTDLFGATLDLSAQHALDGYTDLAAVTAPFYEASSAFTNYLQSGAGFGAGSAFLLATSVAPPRALDRISLTIPRVFGLASLNLSFVNEQYQDGTASRIASLGVTRNFQHNLSTFATAYADLAEKRDYGVMAGLSYSFDNGVNASTQSNLQGGAFSQTTQVTKSAGLTPGDYGYSLNDQEGANRYIRGSATYQTPYGRADVAAGQYGAGRNASAAGSAEFAGSVAVLGGGVALAPEIYDSFAMVDAGAAGVTVLEDNRAVGKTDASGRLLVTGLRGFEPNKISIDPTTLPADAQSGPTELTLRPRARSGVVADFGVRTQARDAEIILHDEAGHALPAGAMVVRAGMAPAIVGYDGRAYLTALDSHNAVTVQVNGVACAAAFDYARGAGRGRPTIGPVTCKAAR